MLGLVALALAMSDQNDPARRFAGHRDLFKECRVLWTVFFAVCVMCRAVQRMVEMLRCVGRDFMCRGTMPGVVCVKYLCSGMIDCHDDVRLCG